MGKIRIKIEWCGSNYAAVPENENIACIATGKTLDEVKMNIVDALKFHVEGLEPYDISEELRGELYPKFVLNVTKEWMDALKKRFTKAKTIAERESVDAEIHELCEADASRAVEIMKQQLQETHKEIDAILQRRRNHNK